MLRHRASSQPAHAGEYARSPQGVQVGGARPAGSVDVNFDATSAIVLALIREPRDTPKYPSFGRRQFEQKVLWKIYSSQDEIFYNTQSSTQACILLSCPIAWSDSIGLVGWLQVWRFHIRMFPP